MSAAVAVQLIGEYMQLFRMPTGYSENSLGR
jgi:hypothetical protein